MYRPRDPQQSLFSTSHFLPQDKRRRLERDWPGQFRRSALPLIDEEAFRDLYHEWNGRPSKPVQTVIGVLLLEEMNDLTDDEARLLVVRREAPRHAARRAPGGCHPLGRRNAGLRRRKEGVARGGRARARRTWVGEA